MVHALPMVHFNRFYAVARTVQRGTSYSEYVEGFWIASTGWDAAGKPVDTICHYNAIILYSRVSYHANMINIGP